MKKKLSREVKIGIYGACMILLLYLGINYIKSQGILSRNRTFYATYENSDGIQSSSPVTLQGYRVGTVEKMWFDMPSNRVILKISVDHEYPLPTGTTAKIGSASLMGGKELQLQLGKGSGHLQDGDTIPSVYEPGLMEILSTEYDKIKEQAGAIVTKLDSALEGINKLFSDENTRNISVALANLRQLTDDASGIVKGDFAHTMHNLNSLSSSLNKEVPGIVSGLGEVVDSARRSVPELLSRGNEAISLLQNVLQDIESGDGTLGMLLKDSTVYNNLTNATKNLNLLVIDIKEHPGSYVHFSVFGGKQKKQDDLKPKDVRKADKKEEKGK